MTVHRSSDVVTLMVHARIKPGARETGVSVGDNATLSVSVKSPPVEGRANAEAVTLIASAFGVPRSRVALVRGARSRIKQFRITDPDTAPPGFAPRRRDKV